MNDTQSAQHATPGRVPGRLYLWLSVALALYVGLLTGNRSERMDADAWEHHRAILAMSENPWHPLNPTYATDDPSIRYSPYTLALALVVRHTPLDAYEALSVAAVFNTLLLTLALWGWLNAYGLGRAAPLVLACVLFLYGEPPGYANSLALSDLPWHQVNPSALVMPLMLLAWAWLKQISGRGLTLYVALTSVLLAASVISHGMSGLAGAFGMFITAMTDDHHRWKKLTAVIASCGIAFALAWFWPYYPFIRAVTDTPDPWYWFNPAVFKRMVLVWCLPAFIASIAALPMRDHPFIRTVLLATAGLVLVTLIGALSGSATLARIPLAGLIFPQAAVGVFLYKVGIGWQTWPGRLKQLLNKDRAVMNRAFVETTVAALVVTLAIPNFWLIAKKPYLARKWIAPIVGAENKQKHLWDRYDNLLTPNIRPGDVCMAEPLTGWPIPSFGGRVVAALHLEFFPVGQLERFEDVTRFFDLHTTCEERADLLRKYNARWILIDRESPTLLPSVYNALMLKDAVVADDGRFVLMDATAWIGKQGRDGTEVNPELDAQ